MKNWQDGDSGVTIQDLFSFTPVDYSTRTDLLDSSCNGTSTSSSTCSMPSLAAGRPWSGAGPGPGPGPGPGTSHKSAMMLSVYKQCWPTPKFFKTMAPNWQLSAGGTSSSRPTKEWARSQLHQHQQQQQQRRGDEVQLWQQSAAAPQVNLDKNTLRWKSWTSQSPAPDGATIVENQGLDQSNNAQLGEYENLEGKMVNTYSNLYRLTAAEFKRLTEQVRDVGCQAQHRYRGTAGFKKFYTTPSAPSGDKVSSVYRSQLASSLKAFRKKEWTPYEHETPDPHYPTRCRPVSSASTSRACSAAGRRRPPSRAATPSVSTREQKRRPKSSPAGTTSNDQLPIANDFDSLTPSVVYELAEGQQPESLYGDRPESRLDDILDDDDSLDDYPACSEEGTASGAAASGQDRGTDIDSDEEEAEPKVEDLQAHEISIPQLELRPEKLDALYIPGFPKGDRRKYDFDAGNVEIPPYEFASPLSEALGMLNLKDLSRSEKNWREMTETRPIDDDDCMFMDRLMALERLQTKAMEAEERAKSAARIKNGMIKSRVGSARVQSGRQRERWCCPDCTQPACVGNCPTKEEVQPPCMICREKHCAGTCTQNAYCGHSRLERGDLSSDRPKSRLQSRPRSCNCCQRRHNAKMINANNLILGRPRSGNATFSRGQFSQKPSDLRPKSAGGASSTVSAELEKDFEKLGLEPSVQVVDDDEKDLSRPSTVGSTGSRKGYRGRAGQIPGKSYFSQRRNSLTDGSTRTRLRLVAAAKRKKATRSHPPRPTTAV